VGDAGHIRGRSRPQSRAMNISRPQHVGEAGRIRGRRQNRAKSAKAAHNSAAIADRISVKSTFVSLIKGAFYYFTNLTPASLHFYTIQ